MTHTKSAHVCITSGIESPHADAAHLYRQRRADLAPPAPAANALGCPLAGVGGGTAHDGSGQDGATAAGVGGGGGGEEGTGAGPGKRGVFNAKEEWLPLRLRLTLDAAAERYEVPNPSPQNLNPKLDAAAQRYEMLHMRACRFHTHTVCVLMDVDVDASCAHA